VRGEGAYLWDASGKRYLDFVSGYSSSSFGHAHPKLVEVVREQVGTLTQVVGLDHRWRGELEEKLVRVFGPALAATGANRMSASLSLGSLTAAGESSELQSSTRELSAPVSKTVPSQAGAWERDERRGEGSGATDEASIRVWLTTTGARAVEAAWKIAYAFRPGAIVAFDHAYHGRSLATAALSDTRRLPIYHAPIEPSLRYPRCDRCPVGQVPDSCHAECFDEDERRLQAEADRISAVIVEPALGARGYYFAPDAFFHRLRGVTERLGIVLIDDEIQMGLGRLGSMTAADRQGWQPDLVVLGKSLGGGIVPIAAVVGRSEIIDCLPNGYESETFAANPLACRTAIEALNILADEELCRRAAGIESLFQIALTRLQADSSVAFEYEVVGAAAVLKTTPPAAERIAKQAIERGLLVHWSGIDRERIVLIPPLIVHEQAIEDAISILSAAIKDSSALCT
jgi:4-aminobutyrate aminotransferase-like enzyme